MTAQSYPNASSSNCFNCAWCFDTWPTAVAADADDGGIVEQFVLRLCTSCPALCRASRFTGHSTAKGTGMAGTSPAMTDIIANPR